MRTPPARNAPANRTDGVRTRPRALTVFAAAFVAGAAAAVGVNRVLDVRLAQLKPRVESESIFVALRSLPQGSPVTVWDVALRDWPKAMMPGTALRARDSFDGMILKHPLREGQPLLSVQLAPADPGRGPAEPTAAAAAPSFVQMQQPAVAADTDLWTPAEPVRPQSATPNPAAVQPTLVTTAPAVERSTTSPDLPPAAVPAVAGPTPAATEPPGDATALPAVDSAATPNAGASEAAVAAPPVTPPESLPQATAAEPPANPPTVTATTPPAEPVPGADPFAAADGVATDAAPPARPEMDDQAPATDNLPLPAEPVQVASDPSPTAPVQPPVQPEIPSETVATGSPTPAEPAATTPPTEPQPVVESVVAAAPTASPAVVQEPPVAAAPRPIYPRYLVVPEKIALQADRSFTAAVQSEPQPSAATPAAPTQGSPPGNTAAVRPLPATASAGNASARTDAAAQGSPPPRQSRQPAPARRGSTPPPETKPRIGSGMFPNLSSGIEALEGRFQRQASEAGAAPQPR